MREIILTVRFKRSLKKFVRRDPLLRKQVDRTLKLMQEDMFAPSLMVHRLKGEYEGLRACSCGYDCRIIFYLERDEKTQTDRIVLINIGTHDEVY
ncbi:MAG: type II toxin-antitoxin system mRNA interferase toxin, RelE/StbE family [Microcystis panniformis Mp_MB_F_20051200_S9]|uniref:Type II toxin-antitoxin system mRNA interferase toxin, RelE/StbE family n=3 Tax=Microcystis TaxID=1125 RepID=A0A552HQQ5_MICVR|nr:MAG: type II toxin-antitoxin system mRNA interferase toxin, RelE/StbE family [Microcystis viridis Mv_BB_P_19951000_S68]TRU72374.1 MAG: type II toxin-antitoxin system mRNA interferase toxin, RelE/StbE family [Microcystis viridis Mv_BB_P_19951000_S69]TRU73529.1 MAG: type II toxin-antitoxin system mRNA interferase toxin, RelE/StbE family [Microcystis viridis Mv_BB_P_19951000_S68D]TRU86049.1 MAG: type II toxin-antitoxin system mRNA interferase toxin, RelE/StbE family [Microcystis novacekii Mn_MB_